MEVYGNSLESTQNVCLSRKLSLSPCDVHISMFEEILCQILFDFGPDNVSLCSRK